MPATALAPAPAGPSGLALRLQFSAQCNAARAAREGEWNRKSES